MSDWDRILAARARWDHAGAVFDTPVADFLSIERVPWRYWRRLRWDHNLEALLAPCENETGEHVGNIVTLFRQLSVTPPCYEMLSTYCGGPGAQGFAISRPVSILGLCRHPWHALRWYSQTHIPWLAVGDLPFGQAIVPEGVEKVIVPRGERCHECREGTLGETPPF